MDNYFRLYSQFTLETILAVAFGSEVNLLKGEGSLLTEAAAGIFDDMNESLLKWDDILYCKQKELLFYKL